MAMQRKGAAHNCLPCAAKHCLHLLPPPTGPRGLQACGQGHAAQGQRAGQAGQV